MTKVREQRKRIQPPEKKVVVAYGRMVQMPEKTTAGGRVFKLSFKAPPALDAQAQARLEAAARKPSKHRRRFPVMIEAPDV